MIPDNPSLIQKTLQTKPKETLREIQGNYKPPDFRAKSDMVIILILIFILIWYFA